MKRAKRAQRVEVLHRSLTSDALNEIARQLDEEERAWRKAIGSPGGFEIPEKPLPATEEECLAELALVTRLGLEALEVRMRLADVPGPEYESAGYALLAYQSRRW